MKTKRKPVLREKKNLSPMELLFYLLLRRSISGQYLRSCGTVTCSKPQRTTTGLIFEPGTSRPKVQDFITAPVHYTSCIIFFLINMFKTLKGHFHTADVSFRFQCTFVINVRFGVVFHFCVCIFYTRGPNSRPQDAIIFKDSIIVTFSHIKASQSGKILPCHKIGQAKVIE